MCVAQKAGARGLSCGGRRPSTHAIAIHRPAALLPRQPSAHVFSAQPKISEPAEQHPIVAQHKHPRPRPQP